MTAPGDLLFGAPVAPGTVMWNPTPSVDINGLRMTPAADGTDPSGIVALGGLRVAWGTDEPLDQSPPATATVSLLDFTRRWAVEQERIGASVVLSWTTPLPSERVFFRGRITSLELTRVDVRRPDGGTVPAIRVDLTCASLETDLANRYPLEDTWPLETIGARAARIAAYCAGVADAVHIREFWTTPNAAAVDNVSKTSIRDLLVQLYTSTGGDRMIYSPQRRTYEHLPRRVSGQRSLLRLWNPGPTNWRYEMGAFVGPDNTIGAGRPATGVDPALPQLGLLLDADDLEYDKGMTRQAASRITRVRLGWTDAGNAKTVEVIAPGADESYTGQRSLTFDSLHASNLAQLNAEDLLSAAVQENATWRPGRFRWDTRRTGGLYNHSLCELLLRGHQVGWPVAINRTWPAALGVRPLFSVTGGVIAYEGSSAGRGRGWVIDIDAAGWGSFAGGNATPTPVKQHAITFEEIDDGTPEQTVRWYDGDHPDGLHASVTFEDLAHVGRGRGNPPIGPDTGFDT